MSGPPALDPLDIAFRAAEAIEAVGGDYFIGGSLASSLQGEARATNDMDIVVQLPLGRITAFVRTLGPDFEVDLEMLREALLHGGSANMFFLPTVLKVDLFAIGATAYDDMEFKRRRAVVEVLRVSGASMDDEYLSRWAAHLQLSELLARARAAV